jgi:hypothetical protein
MRDHGLEETGQGRTSHGSGAGVGAVGGVIRRPTGRPGIMFT